MRLPIGTHALALLAAACGDQGLGREPLHNPVREHYDTWRKVEPPGVVCGNGSPYKFFVNFSDASDNLVVVFEPGGACWDYDSCAGRTGIRGAANPDGIPDDHWELAPFESPFLSRFDDTTPSREWNMVYVPYCTGDVHTGEAVVTYTSSDSAEPALAFHHGGHRAAQAVVAWIDAEFTRIPKLLVTGCSAGGVGALANYHFLRTGVSAVEQGYLINDSGPIFPTGGYSGPLHARIRASWHLDALRDVLPAGATLEDMSSINVALADLYPDDRFATTLFRRDDNYSRYSYERFYGYPPKEEILRMWDHDVQLLAKQLESRPNLNYFIPYFRNINDSHCTTVINFVGSDIQERGMTLARWVDDFVADRPVENMMEAPVPGEDR